MTASRYDLAEKHFWHNVQIEIDSCWIWRGHIDDRGYARVRTKLGNVRMHRLSFKLKCEALEEIDFDEIDFDAVHVLHSCDMRCCVNPDHLSAGTNAENTADKVARGRQVKGARINTAVLTEVMVIAIRADPRSRRKVAADYGIHYSTVSDIMRRETWKHI